jgi:predicted ester cyclase
MLSDPSAAVPTASLRLTGTALQTAFLVHRYYALFNERRFDEAELLVDPQALFTYPGAREHVVGRAGYRELVRRWVEASPDGRIRIADLVLDDAQVARVSLIAEGTHSGVLDLPGLPRIPPTHRHAQFPMQEILTWAKARLIVVRLEFDTAALQRLLG